MTIDACLDQEDLIDTDRPDFDFFDNDEPQITNTGTTSTDTTTTQTIEINDSTRLVLAARDPLLGTGGLSWPAGQVLATYLLAHPHLFTSKSIIELGSGSGIVGLSCATFPQDSPSTTTKVILTDLPQVLPILSRNAQLNDLQDRVHIQDLIWGQTVPPDLQDSRVILLADCIYLESLFEPLLDTLSQVMIHPQAVAYLSYKKRRKADVKFFKLLKKTFHLQELQYVSDPILSHGIHLYRVVKK